MIVHVGPFSVDTIRDADIIAEFEDVRNKSEYFRQKMRRPEGADIVRRIAADVQEIKEMLQSGVVVQSENDEPVNDRLVDLCDRALSGLGAE